jgi:hypothetical protein
MAGRWPWLTVVVVAWWLLIAMTVAPMLPSPVSSATTSALLVPAQPARIAQHGIRDWPIATSRAAFGQLQRSIAESNEALMDDAFVNAEWLTVNGGDAVLILAVDGEVVEIELLEGSYAGRHAWLNQHQLTPWD